MESYTQDEYIENEDYVNRYYFKGNNKKDPWATKFKRIPIHKITMDDVIPDEPQEKHDKPNDSYYQKELDKINAEIERHNKNK